MRHQRIRPGEVAIDLPATFDAGLYSELFICGTDKLLIRLDKGGLMLVVY